MVTNRDFRSFLMDALSATETFAVGIRETMSKNEARCERSTAPNLNESRFWVMARNVTRKDHDLIAWSPVRKIARTLAHLAVSFGLVEVRLVDTETLQEEDVRSEIAA